MYHTIDNEAVLCYNTYVMKIKQTLENKLYSYNPREFMPIYRDGQLSNKAGFIKHKVKTTAYAFRFLK